MVKKNGACGMYPGDRVIYTINGKSGVAKEFLQDGDAYVDFDDGSDGNVKWNHLQLEKILVRHELVRKDLVKFGG